MSIFGNDFGFPQYQPRDEVAETSTRRDGTEFISVSEFVRRISPQQYPVVRELISDSGVDRTYMVLGTMAASTGKAFNVQPAKLYHPTYDSINGWPLNILQSAWRRFTGRYDIEWLDRDPAQEPTAPAPVAMPSLPFSTKLLDQLTNSLRMRGIELPVTKDPRWQGAYSMLTGTREDRDETPEEAMVRRQSAAAALFMVEKEYAGR